MAALDNRPMRLFVVLAAVLALATAPAHAAKKKPKRAASASRPASAKAASTAATPGTAGSYGPREDIQAFAAEMAGRRGLDSTWIVKELAQARRSETVQRLMMPGPAGTARNWASYRERFIEPRRISAGLAFWQANEAWFVKAEQRWGVPADVILGILGIETFYGRMNGGFRVIDALATLSFDFPTGRRDRSAFFRSELEEFLVLCAREGVDPLQPKGSFAGAMGMAQFMPGSVNRYAVDFDDDGRIDLTASAADAIGSIAHYLAQQGWQSGLPTHYPVTPPASDGERALLLAPDIVPTFTAAQMAEHGAVLPPSARDQPGLLALVLLENGDQPPSYVAGTTNFYAVTRYNWSSFYAMAVIELGEALDAARAAAPGTAPATRADPRGR